MVTCIHIFEGKEVGVANKIIIKLLLITGFLMPLEALAKEQSNPYYLKAEIGVDSMEKDLKQSFKKNTLVTSVGAGYEFNDFLSVDLNSQYRRLNTLLLPFKSSSYTSFVNGNINLMDSSYPEIIYLTCGVGISYNKTGNFIKTSGSSSFQVFSDTKSTFAWNTGIGVKKHFVDNIWANIVVKYVDLGYIKANKIEINKVPVVFFNNKLRLTGVELMSGLTTKF